MAIRQAFFLRKVRSFPPSRASSRACFTCTTVYKHASFCRLSRLGSRRAKMATKENLPEQKKLIAARPVYALKCGPVSSATGALHKRAPACANNANFYTLAAIIATLPGPSQSLPRVTKGRDQEKPGTRTCHQLFKTLHACGMCLSLPSVKISTRTNLTHGNTVEDSS